MSPFEPLEVYTLFDSVLPTSTGIYAIVNRLNGKFYIGSARATADPNRRGFRGRFYIHRDQLKDFSHHCEHFLNSYKKTLKAGLDPNDVYQIWILESVEPELCIKREQDYLDIYWPTGSLYNMSDKASGGGGKQSLETRLKRSQSLKERSSPMKGRKHTPESCRKMSLARKGKVPTVETRQKISAAHKGNTYNVGRKHTPEAIANMSKAQQGKKLSAEHIIKLSKSHIGNTSAKRQFYVAISPDGDHIYFVNAKAFCDSEFGRLHKFNRCKISSCAKGTNATHRGFRFHYAEDFLFGCLA